MLDLQWLLRMSRWVRNPPGWRAFLWLLVVVGLCALLIGVEMIFGWPEALTPERLPGRGGPALTKP